MIELTDLFSQKAVHGDNARDFVGRHDLIEKGIDALSAESGNAVIFGPRGIGKTSLAWQIATTLDDTNPRFHRADVATIGLLKQFAFVFIKCPAFVRTLEDLLVSLLLPSPDDHSLSTKFASVYYDKTVRSILRRKYEFSIASLAKATLDYDDQSSESLRLLASALTYADKPTLVRGAFAELAHQVKARTKRELVIVIDEAERLANIPGIGQYLKDTDHPHFLFVGIAENLSAIIKDHESAARKVAFGNIGVPEFTEAETMSLFSQAKTKSRGKVTFSEDFVKQVVAYSYGYPWVAKQVGLAALQNAVRRNRRLVTGRIPIEIMEKDFQPAVDSVLSIYRGPKGEEYRLDGLIDSELKAQILGLVWHNPVGIAEAKLRQSVDQNHARFTSTVLQSLIDDGILASSKDEQIRYSEPILRILVKYLIDDWMGLSKQ